MLQEKIKKMSFPILFFGGKHLWMHAKSVTLIENFNIFRNKSIMN